MKLLFDNNISHKLVARLVEEFPGSTHVMMEGLDESADLEVWKYAKNHGYTIITKDSDYNEISMLKGFPPKIIWLRIGNCSVPVIEAIIRSHAAALHEFRSDPISGVIEID